MGTEFINPNWHVILIHFPLGVFMLGLLLEVLLLLFRQHGTVRAAARWMVVLGALAALPAAYSGMYAMADVARRTAPAAADNAPWHVVAAASSLSDTQWELLDKHAWTNGGAAIFTALLVTLAVACSDRWRRRLYVPLLVLLLGYAGAMVVGAYYGGEMVYREAIGVKLPPRTHEALAATHAPIEAASIDAASRDAAATQPDPSAGAEPSDLFTRADQFVDPMQTHVTLAGLAAAMCLLGVGLSLRAVSTSPHWSDPEFHRAGLAARPNKQRGGAEDMALLRSFAPRVEITGEVERIPVARFWLLTLLIVAVTSLAGWWVLGHGHGTYRPQNLWKLVMSEGHVRRLAHVVGAGAVVALPLFMAILARVARRSRATAGLFAMLLVMALAAQVWLGILLLFDQSKTPAGAEWYRFQKPAVNVPEPPTIATTE